MDENGEFIDGFLIKHCDFPKIKPREPIPSPVEMGSWGEAGSWQCRNARPKPAIFGMKPVSLWSVETKKPWGFILFYGITNHDGSNQEI